MTIWAAVSMPALAKHQRSRNPLNTYVTCCACRRVPAVQKIEALLDGSWRSEFLSAYPMLGYYLLLKVHSLALQHFRIPIRCTHNVLPLLLQCCCATTSNASTNNTLLHTQHIHNAFCSVALDKRCIGGDTVGHNFAQADRPFVLPGRGGGGV